MESPLALPFPLSPKGHILKQEFGQRGKIKAFTLHKDGGLGKSEVKPKDTMLRAEVGDNIRTGKVVSSAF
uniref:Uncharacterized protein n=1 Tax=Catagonus wagneri TaxID=51154 RepID=A0A8C3YQ16_9CETA